MVVMGYSEYRERGAGTDNDCGEVESEEMGEVDGKMCSTGERHRLLRHGSGATGRRSRLLTGNGSGSRRSCNTCLLWGVEGEGRDEEKDYGVDAQGDRIAVMVEGEQTLDKSVLGGRSMTTFET